MVANFTPPANERLGASSFLTPARPCFRCAKTVRYCQGRLKQMPPLRQQGAADAMSGPRQERYPNIRDTHRVNDQTFAVIIALMVVALAFYPPNPSPVTGASESINPPYGTTGFGPNEIRVIHQSTLPLKGRGFLFKYDCPALSIPGPLHQGEGETKYPAIMAAIWQGDSYEIRTFLSDSGTQALG